VMIVYFLTSGDWSNPLQLQRGHELVAKTERQRSELLVKRNLVVRQIADLNNKATRAQESLTRADTLARIVNSTIDQEIANRKQRVATLRPEIIELEAVLAGYGSPSERRAELARIRRDYRQRIISRRAYDVASLNQVQLDREFALMRQRINDKRELIGDADQIINYLHNLKNQANQMNVVVGHGAVSEFIPLANQMIEVRQIRSIAKSDIASMQESKPGLENSIQVLDATLAEIESTPMFRAQEKPVNVLFVPYDNIDAYSEGKSLYACAFAIFWCSDVGKAGKAIGGEIVTNHPFFGKPIRGQFVEANLTDPSAAKKEIIHVGRAPLFF